MLPRLPADAPRSRLALAGWIVSRDNPLTARVAVNRMWLYSSVAVLSTRLRTSAHKGSVPVIRNCWTGLQWSLWIRGWSVKQMHRTIVLSSTYRQSSHTRKELAEKDPYNILLARQFRLRLDAELLRDAALASSGLLYPAVGGPSIRPPQPAGLTNLGYGDFVKWEESKGREQYRRGLYIFFQRTVPYPMLVNFDAPDSNLTCARRIRSTTPLQSLNLLNDPVFFEAAQALALRILRAAGTATADRLDRAFLLALARSPSASEKEQALAYLDRQSTILRNEPAAVGKLAPGILEGIEPSTAGGVGNAQPGTPQSG